MMSAGSIVIKEFLASVGFRADEKSLKSSLAKVAAFGVGVQAVALGIYAGITRVASGEAQLARQAETLGTTSDKLQEIGYVAEQSGVSLDAVTQSLERMVRKNPGIKNTVEALEQAGDRMKKMNAEQRLAYAMKMGIDTSLIPVLIKDASTLKDEFRAMYAVAGMDAKAAGEASKEFMGEIGKLTTMVGLLAKGVSLAFIGRIRHDVEHLRRMIVENFDKIKRVLETMVRVVLRIAAVISAFAYRVIKWVSSLVQWFDKLDDGQKKLVVGAGLLLAAWRLLNAGFLATPMGMLITGLLAIVALVDEYLTYMEGGESYFDWGPWADSIETARRAVSSAIDAVSRFIANNQELLTAVGKGVGIVLGLKAALMGVAGAGGLVGSAVKVLWGILRANPLGLIITAAMLIYEYWEPISDFFKNLWAGIAESFPNFAAWAEGAAGAITGILGKAIQWVKDKLGALLEFMPDWIKDKMGLNINMAAESAQAMQNVALAPGPAATASMDDSSASNVELNAKTEIHMHTSDPVAAGNQAAARQAQVGADLVRHTKGAVK
ncbi:MAG: hypothetical protein FWG04_02600 [Desulfovibrionaceae bacterium]|nr:hypothetical protein [Desulfovibrionaceae bacterium]